MTREPTLAEKIAGIASLEELEGFRAELKHNDLFDMQAMEMIGVRRAELMLGKK